MKISSASLEKGLFRAYWDDGLLDILFGVALLLTGIGWETRLGVFAVLQAPLWIILWTPLRRAIVEPRAGYVRHSLARQQRNTLQLAATATLGIGILAAILLLTYLAPWQGAVPAAGNLVAGLPAVLVAAGTVLGGILTGARRLLAYAVVLLAAAAATVYFDRGPALPLTVAGAVVLLSGLCLLTRFVRASRDYREVARP